MNLGLPTGGAVSFDGKQNYKSLAKFYREQNNAQLAKHYGNLHNEAKARLHYYKFLKGEEKFGDSLAKFEAAVNGDKFLPEFKAFGRLVVDTAKMVKERVLSAFYYTKSGK